MKTETLDLFGVRATADGRGLILPVYSFTGALIGVKIISAAEETDSVKTHITTRTIPRSGSWWFVPDLLLSCEKYYENFGSTTFCFTNLL